MANIFMASIKTAKSTNILGHENISLYGILYRSYRYTSTSVNMSLLKIGVLHVVTIDRLQEMVKLLQHDIRQLYTEHALTHSGVR